MNTHLFNVRAKGNRVFQKAFMVGTQPFHGFAVKGFVFLRKSTFVSLLLHFGGLSKVNTVYKVIPFNWKLENGKSTIDNEIRSADAAASSSTKALAKADFISCRFR